MGQYYLIVGLASAFYVCPKVVSDAQVYAGVLVYLKSHEDDL